jgi:hypothetical protein
MGPHFPRAVSGHGGKVGCLIRRPETMERDDDGINSNTIDDRLKQATRRPRWPLICGPTEKQYGLPYLLLRL